MKLSSVDEFAKRLDKAIGSRVRPRPNRLVIRALVRTSFYASIEVEEHRSLRFALAYLDDAEIDASHGGRDIWSPCRFTRSLPLDVEAVRKLAPANEPTRSVLAVTGDARNLQVVGIVRRTSGTHRYARGETDRARGLDWDALVIQASGPGDLRAFVGDEFVMAFARGEIFEAPAIPIFNSGIVFQRLAELARAASYDMFPYIDVVHQSLLRMADRGHGGTLVIDAGENDSLVMEGHQLESATSLRDVVLALMGQNLATTIVRTTSHRKGESEDDRVEAERRDTANDAVVAESERRMLVEDSAEFAADLASVDGALVCSTDLHVRRFGAKLTAPRADNVPIVHALSVDGLRQSKVSPIAHAGTRHRSAANFCIASPGSLAFVVSEDGPVSAMYMRPGDNVLLVWRPIALVSSFIFREVL